MSVDVADDPVETSARWVLILFTGVLIHVTSRADHCGFVLNPVTHCGADVVFVSVVECACLCCGMRVSWLVECPEGLESVPSVLKSVSENHAVTHARLATTPALPSVILAASLGGWRHRRRRRHILLVAPPADRWRWRRRPVQNVRLLPPAPPRNSLPRRANGPLGFLNVFRCRPSVRAVLGFQARSLGAVIACRPVRIPVASAVFFFSRWVAAGGGCGSW